MWEQLLLEADRNGDGMVSENEFADAMSNIIRKSLRTPKMNGRKNQKNVEMLINGTWQTTRNTTVPTSKNSLIFRKQ